MNPGREPSRRPGVLLLAVGIALELVGALTLVWQEQDVYTINSSLALPAWGAMLVSVGLIARGYGRLLGSTPARPALPWAIVGVVGGAVLLTAALAWQLTYGLIPSGNLDLDVYAALALFFVGVAVLTTAIRALGRPDSATNGGGMSTMRTGGGSAARALPPIVLLAVGAAFLASAGAEAGWLSSQAAHTNSLYQLVAAEIALGGAWLLLSGASSFLGLVPSPRREDARRGGMLAGLLFLAAGAATWWWTAPLAYALSEILLGASILGGVGLLLVSWSTTTLGRARDGSASS